MLDAKQLEALITRAKRGDAAALAEIVDNYADRVFGLVYRLTRDRGVSEDLVQETFLRLVRTIETYQHDGRFEAWLFRIAANLARDHLRRGRRRGVVVSLDSEDEASGGWEHPPTVVRSPDDAAERREEHLALEVALSELNEIDREIVILRHFADMPFKEIAELLAIPLGTALARAHRAVKRLRGILDRSEMSEAG